MILSNQNLSKIPSAVGLTAGQISALPEKVLEFGTGVLLRGLPNYFIDKANRQGVFNGRVVVIKSTDKGGTEAFANQDSLYTLCVRGVEDGQMVDDRIINSSISRVLSAKSDWSEILKCAANPELQIVVSNTTETGLKLLKEDNIFDTPPISFPGKLVAFLHERYKIFEGSLESGMVILPTELVSENGKVLKDICLQLAAVNMCDEDFMYWLINANDFCNTLVDRIVPGALPSAEHEEVQKAMGCVDNLMIMAEPYRLWAIETSSERTKNLLSFAKVDAGVVIDANINKYREIKIRLLNAPHTFSCALAVLCGFPTVKEAMQNNAFKSFISDLMHNEIAPTIVGNEISESDAKIFADKVLDRFANPFIAHEWISISAQYTSKILTRCVPVLLNHYMKSDKAPRNMVLGLAAYILFMNSEKDANGQFTGKANGKTYNITDEKAPTLLVHWKSGSLDKVVHSVLSDKSLWNTDLTQLPGFEKSVLSSVELLASKNPREIVEADLVSL